MNDGEKKKRKRGVSSWTGQISDQEIAQGKDIQLNEVLLNCYQNTCVTLWANAIKDFSKDSD